ncbi:MAG: hypothetical protein O3B76_04750 [Proteobacteria bacterium]|nr:hypothetical protein [Pseudomonadota bacterium]MDA1022953.1 hypothetical protein [Pseudomonadota bacterium]
MSESLSFAPMLPAALIGLLALVGAGLCILALLKGGRGWLPRALVLAVLVLALANPQAVREVRDPRRDVALVVVDRSPSQLIGERAQQTDDALKTVRETLSGFDDLEVRIMEISGDDEGTRLFGPLNRKAADIPRKRFAGAILITDGQVHDLDKVETKTTLGPMHVLLTGAPDQSDRRLVIEKAPGYGIVGKPVTIRYRVEDRRGKKGGLASDLAKIRFKTDDKEETVAQVPVGKSREFTFTLDHGGPTVVEFEVDAAKGELSTVNNRTLVSINGVRDRLRVLLVSGQPHAGERTWRNLLKSDPSVDLVHFTILRPPEKDDFTPLQELALIAFPVQELFEEKLSKFNLIVFDRYVVRDVLPPSYLRNIVRFVNEGGALLLAVGPEFATTRSLYQTPLGKVMAASPTGRVLEQGFRPQLSDIGKRHPVTANLKGDGDLEWGRWFRQIDAINNTGQVLMQGPDGKPLLVLERKGKGRTAQFLSDHIWLWARGFEGGGPQGELLRRLAHWLMKEPDLEEESLAASVKDGRLTVTHRSLKGDNPEITVTTPSGQTKTLSLKKTGDGPGKAILPVKEPGLYKVSDGIQTALATMGALNPLEYSDLRASAEKIRPIVAATGGGVHWLQSGPPDIRRTRPGRGTAGQGWIGLTANKSFVVSGLTQVALFPGILVMVIVLGGLMMAWHKEGR